MATEKQDLLEIIIVTSPSLKKTKYSYKDITDTEEKGFFTEGDLTEEEILEDFVQRLANYDSFYNAPVPIDKGEVKEIERIQRFTKDKIIAAIVVLIIVVLVFIFF